MPACNLSRLRKGCCIVRTPLTRHGASPGGGDKAHPGEKKGKAFNPALLMEGPIADAINELRAVVAQARFCSLAVTH
jgi:hypothetical protein